MLVSVVIPTYNVIELLKQNLPHVIKALEKYDRNNVELIVTDNFSSDTSVEFLNELKEKTTIPMTVLANTWNGGFAVNVNRGVRVAKGDIVILLGTDVNPSVDFIKPLVKHFADEKLFAVGCLNKSDQDTDETLRGRGIGKWEKGFLFHGHGELINDDTLWVDCGSGAFRKEIWDKIGGLQELYRPFYWEDVDLSYRAQKMGYTVKIEKESTVIHEHKKGSIKKSEKSAYVTQTVYRNQFFFVWLNITDKNLLLNHLLYLPYHLLVAIKNRNWLFIKGFMAAVSRLGKVISERQKNTWRYKVSDQAILKRFENEVK